MSILFFKNIKCAIIYLVNNVNNKIKNILNKLIENGYEAYVVGGFVRDYLLGRGSYDVDISTSAEPKEIKEIFNLSNSNDENYGHVFFKDSLYNYDITTFRKENKYENRRPVDIEYIEDIKEDILRRDFTINSLFMDIDGNIHDIVNGKEDLENKIIRVVGSINDKMVDDPLRMLRAIRFASLLDFTIEPTLYNYIRQNKQLIRTLSYTRKKDELEKIFKGQNKLKGIELIKDLKLESELEIELPDNIEFCENPLGIWAQITVSDEYPFKKSDEDKINDIKKILNYGIIDNIVLYEYGLYTCIIAGEILGVSRTNISEIYKNMPIYSSKDIALKGDDIIEILEIEPSEKIKDIQFDLVINILNNNIKNDYEELKQFLLENWR